MSKFPPLLASIGDIWPSINRKKWLAIFKTLWWFYLVSLFNDKTPKFNKLNKRYQAALYCRAAYKASQLWHTELACWLICVLNPEVWALKW